MIPEYDKATNGDKQIYHMEKFITSAHLAANDYLKHVKS